MGTEWALLWIHFMWSGVLIFVFSIGTWMELGRIMQYAAGGASDGAKRLATKRRRILFIAVMTASCLLMNMTATLLVSVTLDSWSRSEDISLNCNLFETFASRDWAAYGFGSEPTTVCSLNDLKPHGISSPGLECTGACAWVPDLEDEYLVCPIYDTTMGALFSGDVQQQYLTAGGTEQYNSCGAKLLHFDRKMSL
jgi:hypothetical protein